MSEQGAVPMIVMTRSQDHVEAINSTLRKAGHPVHCTWLPDARDLVGCPHAAQSRDAGRLHRRARHRPGLAHEDQAAERARDAGADRARAGRRGRDRRGDALGRPGRGDARQPQPPAVGRDPRAARLPPRARAVDARCPRRASIASSCSNFLEGSADAITHVQEGIIVDANRAWLELFGYSGDDALTGTPLMDLFEQETHPALKGALVACLQGKWTRSRRSRCRRCCRTARAAARADARARPTTRTSPRCASASRRATRRITISSCSSPTRSRTTPRRGFCSSATWSPPCASAAPTP